MLRIHYICSLSAVVLVEIFYFKRRQWKKKEELRVAICGNATNIAAYVEHSFKDKYDLKFYTTAGSIGYAFLCEITDRRFFYPIC
jgi:hypothetical protein